MQSFDYGPSFLRFIILLISGRLVNNKKKNLEKISDARNNKQTSRNQQNNKPKKRRSVIKRLHQKQIAIARRSGKPIPKYLDQEMERKRG